MTRSRQRMTDLCRMFTGIGLVFVAMGVFVATICDAATFTTTGLTYGWSSRIATLGATAINNISASGTSGSLKLQLVARPYALGAYDGSTLTTSDTIMAEYILPGTMTAGQKLSSVTSGPLVFTWPSPGSYYFAIRLLEYTGSSYAGKLFGSLPFTVSCDAGGCSRTGYDSVPIVTEFYNVDLDNYFITRDPNEKAAIDSGSAGPGWLRTGHAFYSGGSTPVCRFYGSVWPGPNSHFYTLAGAECDGLKQLQAATPDTDMRWNFESLDFMSTAATSGQCPSGTLPVYRAYNNGFTRGVDSNHRIAISLVAIQEVVAEGWNNEGVVMCSPQY